MHGVDWLRLIMDFWRVISRQESQFEPEQYGVTAPSAQWVLRQFSDSWKLALFLSSLPGLYLLVLASFGGLGGNPTQAFHQFTGLWAMRILWVTLVITPIQSVTRWKGLADFRQLFGLMAFFYAGLHLYGYLAIDLGWHWSWIGRDLWETSYLWFGLFSFIILFLLAITSPKEAKRYLGKRWKKLHRWIYPAAIAAVLHYAYQLKGNLADPLGYAIILLLLFAFRVGAWFKKRQIARLMIPVGPKVRDDTL